MFRLNRAFPLLPQALGNHRPDGGYHAGTVRKHLARTLLNEMVGSGPYRFLPDQRVSGARNVYAKFDEYVPREGRPALRRAAGREFRPGGVADHAGSRDTGGGPAARRGRLGGTAVMDLVPSLDGVAT